MCTCRMMEAIASSYELVIRGQILRRSSSPSLWRTSQGAIGCRRSTRTTGLQLTISAVCACRLTVLTRCKAASERLRTARREQDVKQEPHDRDRERYSGQRPHDDCIHVCLLSSGGKDGPGALQEPPRGDGQGPAPMDLGCGRLHRRRVVCDASGVPAPARAQEIALRL